jgi:hypothetical protein
MPPTARKSTGAAARNAGTATPKDDEPDLLSDLKDDGPAPSPVDDDEVLDLLDGLSEDEGTPWIPDDEDDPSPEGIQGRVKFVGEVASDYGPEMCPIIELEAADGVVWSIRGYSTVLRNQITKADPKVGDIMAVRYFGVKTGKNSREYKNYKVAVKHAA